MFNYTLIIIFVAVFWLGAFLFYMYLSRQQEEIGREIESLEEMLGPEEINT